MDTKKHDEALQEILEKFFKKLWQRGIIPIHEKAPPSDLDEALQQIRDAGFIHKSEVVLNEQTIRGDIAVADDKYDLELTIDQVNKLAHVIAQAGKEIVK